MDMDRGSAIRLGPRAGSASGFTLIELMIAVAVVAILAVVAIPSYSAYVIRGKRAEAKTALLQAAQYLERNFSQAGCYNFTDAPTCNNLPSATGGPVTVPAPSAPDYAFNPPPLLNSQNYVLTATPCATLGGCANGSAFADAQCGALTLDNTGAMGALGASATQTTANATGTVLAAIQQCWQR